MDLPSTLTRQASRYRVARRAHRYQGIIGDPALLDTLVTIRQPRSERRELFAGKAIRRPFVSRPVKPRIGYLGMSFHWLGE
jgi:hypothetical protein